jgi:hypothetical protein
MKLKIIITLLVFIFLYPFSYSQPDTLWTKTFGGTNIDVGYSIQQTNDGGFIIAGYTRSYGTMSGRNLLLIKTDMNGNQQWINGYGGNQDDEGSSVKQTLDGGYIAAGYTKSFGSGGSDLFLVKTDSLGNQLWSKNFGGTLDDEGFSVEVLNNGYLVAGVTSSFGAGSRDVYLIKTDLNGNQVWTKTLGGLSSDGARLIQITKDGGFIITGWTYSNGPGILGNAWLVKTDSLGNQLWQVPFGGPNVDRGMYVQSTNDNGYILTGYTDSFGAGLYDMYLIKTNDLGDTTWTKTFGGSGRDYGNSVQQTGDNGYVVTGYTLSFGAGGDDLWLVKTNSNGNEEWSKTFGGTASDVGNDIKVTSDGGLIVVGHTLSYGAGLHDVWLIRLETIVPVEFVSFTYSIQNNNVTLNWITASETNNYGFEVERSEKQGVRGEMWEKIGFVSGNGTTTEQQFYSFTDENLSAGKYQYRLKQIDFDGSFEYSNVIEAEINTPLKFSLSQNYPNPFNPSTTLSFVIGQRSFVSLKIFNSLGEEVETLVNEFMEAGFHSTLYIINSTLPSGVYYYRLTAGDFVATKKMILLK